MVSKLTRHFESCSVPASLQAATVLHGKLSVCDPVSISKATPSVGSHCKVHKLSLQCSVLWDFDYPLTTLWSRWIDILLALPFRYSIGKICASPDTASVQHVGLNL
eukprot:2672879-Amphidinium_carterae.3